MTTEKLQEIPMSVEDRILKGCCEDCDQDPTQCWLKDYCLYEENDADD